MPIELWAIENIDTGHTTVKNFMVGKVPTQRVAAAKRSQEAGLTFPYYKGNPPEFF